MMTRTVIKKKVKTEAVFEEVVLDDKLLGGSFVDLCLVLTV